MNRTSSVALQSRIRAVLQLAGPEQHVQEIAGVAQFVVRIDERHSQAMPVGERRQRRHLPDQAIGLLAPRFGIENILRFGIEGRERRHRRDHHAHRVGVVVKAVEKLLDAFVDEGVMRDVVGPVLQLRFGGQLAVENQVSRFEVRAFFRQFFDGIAAVAQDALVAVDVSDFACAGCGVRRTKGRSSSSQNRNRSP